MDKYRTTLKRDIRFINRSKRHHEIDPKEIEEYLNNLPDSTGNARWLDQDGTPITDGRADRLNTWHQNKLEDFFQIKYEDEQPAIEAAPATEEPSEA